MHELSVCRSLLEEVERVAAANDASAVEKIVVAVGSLSGVEASSLARTFAVARAGTIAEHAVIEVETVPALVWCEACAIATPAAANTLLCGRCGSWQVELRSGTELVLRRVELTTRASPAAASG